MTNGAACENVHAGEEHPCYTWLEDYLERLDGKDAYREFQEGLYTTPDYHTLVAALAA